MKWRFQQVAARLSLFDQRERWYACLVWQTQAVGRAENVAVVEAVFGAFNANDLDRAYDYYLPEASYLGQPRVAHGVEEMRAVDSEFFDAFPDHHREIKQLLADGDVVAVLLDVKGTNLGSRGGAPPTGRSIRFQVCNIIELRDRRIVSMRQIYDSAEISEQLA